MSPADRTSPDSDSRQVAVTFDDLPAISVANGDLVARRRTTLGLLAALDVHRIPAVGFVNESMLLQQGVLDASQVALLDQWLDAGHELGNHTFSHLDLHRVPVEAYEADAARGDEVMRELLQRRGARRATSATPTCTPGWTSRPSTGSRDSWRSGDTGWRR